MHATTRVRGREHRRDRVSGPARPVAGSKSTQRTSAPLASAAITQGRTLASWSSRVTTTSSPGSQSLASARARSKVSWVMLRPNTTPSGTPPIRSATCRPRRQHHRVGVALGRRQVAAVGERLGDRRRASRRPPRRGSGCRPARRSTPCRRPGWGSARAAPRRRTRSDGDPATLVPVTLEEAGGDADRLRLPVACTPTTRPTWIWETYAEPDARDGGGGRAVDGCSRWSRCSAGPRSGRSGWPWRRGCSCRGAGRRRSSPLRWPCGPTRGWWSTWAAEPARSPRRWPCCCRDAEVHGVDVDERALACARRTGGFAVHQGSWWDGLPRSLAGRVALAVAYLPHVPTDRLDDIHPDFRVPRADRVRRRRARRPGPAAGRAGAEPTRGWRRTGCS